MTLVLPAKAAPAVASLAPYRADHIEAALDAGERDGSVVLFLHTTSDQFMHDGALRSLPHVIAQWGARRNMATVEYSLAGGVRVRAVPEGPIAEPPSPGPGAPATVIMDELFGWAESQPPTQFVIDWVEGVLPRPGDGGGLDALRVREQIASHAASPAWRLAGHRLVIVGRAGDVDDELRRLPGIRSVPVGLPVEGERAAAIAGMRTSGIHPLNTEPDLDDDALARITGGMTLDAISRMRFSSTSSRPLSQRDVLARKNEELRASAGDDLVIHPPRDIREDVAALSQVRRYAEDLRLLGSRTARLLLPGPSGVGKTLVATALATEMGMLAVSLGATKDQWVGSSERNLLRKIQAIEAAAPIFVFIDEAEGHGLGSRGRAEDDVNGVESGMRSIMLEWLGDVGADSGVSVVAITNEPDSIDASFLDRLTVIPVLHPATPTEMARIAQIQARRIGVELDLAGVERAFAADRGLYSGRHIVQLLELARLEAAAWGRTDVREEDMLGALGQALHRIGEREELRALRAIAHASSARYLPWLLDGASPPPPFVAPYLRPDGRPDQAALERRSEELRARVR